MASSPFPFSGRRRSALLSDRLALSCPWLSVRSPSSSNIAMGSSPQTGTSHFWSTFILSRSSGSPRFAMAWLIYMTRDMPIVI
ncbi:hypothetical protein BCR35DRAFT_227447 [Leucosporidium creatinivorum]|uniref:Uncharacterized protein n=1 Tax=Leucosporidium creatinivorum TaxID=106004 RepID=A0A1Y2D4Q3_9BASI|nr:hypothetical protein BCR35DRAFT_227447 [Leucosporidium creatinivorum]